METIMIACIEGATFAGRHLWNVEVQNESQLRQELKINFRCLGKDVVPIPLPQF